MESAKNYQQPQSKMNNQQQPTQYYTQDPNTGAQQVYYVNQPVQYGQPMPQPQPQIQYVQAPVQVVQIQQQQPQVIFRPNCPQCCGTGVISKTFGLRKKPCDLCYRTAGVCYKCGGTGQTRKGKPCKNCAFHSNAGVCPACTLKKAFSGRNNRPCMICKTYQRVTYDGKPVSN